MRKESAAIFILCAGLNLIVPRASADRHTQLQQERPPMTSPFSWFVRTQKSPASRDSRVGRFSDRRRLSVEHLEDRRLMSVVPNDVGFPAQWPLNHIGQTGGKYDADIDMPAAWSITTGSMDTIVAILDSGVDYTHPDLYLNMWLNQAEIPSAIAASLIDTDGDSLLTFRDLNGPANGAQVIDVNGNGYIDGGDLLNDSRWENGIDEDDNGKVDDLIGWDTHDNDNDPAPSEDHGTRMCEAIGAVGNNNFGTAGVNWEVRMMPVRVQFLSDTRNNANAAAGLDYAVSLGASISLNRRDNTYSQEVFDAMDRARAAGHLCVAGSGNLSQDIDITPFYPASYNLDNILVVAAVDASEALTSQSSWGLQSVDLAAPSHTSAVSPALANATGVAALLKSLHPDWDYAQLKAQLMATVDPIPALAGKTVTGGRLNAAHALATTSISISDPSITEGNAGTQQLVFSVTRFGDSTGSVILDWSTASGTASAGSDFVAASGQVTFLASGENSQSITVDVVGDLALEASEKFFVNLSMSSGNALLADEQAQAAILDNDPARTIAIADRTATEGSDANAVFSVTLSASADVPIVVAFSTANATALAGSDFTPTAGTITFAPGQTQVALSVAILNDTNFEPSESFVVNLSNPTAGVTIADAQAVGTILDNDPQPTKFYVVNDATTNVNYEYGPTGAAIENYALNSGNATPRGAASTVAGDNVWVVDANRKVFVYDTSGGLLGSWTAGTLASNAEVQGIATNGTDVWIVDAKSDKVFKYAGAATRLSGSQNAASSFSLNSGNGNPSDFVTDGASLWVTNDAAQNKVFKYTVAGSLLGSWTIDAANGTPTGITIDPGNVSAIWIVDSGTDTVYQYSNAANRISGSQAADVIFSLAAGNTNPQGIADPPPAGAGASVSQPLTARAVDRALSQLTGHLDGKRPAVSNLLGVKEPETALVEMNTARNNGDVFFDAATAFDDGDRDFLTGAAGLDWLLFNRDGADEDRALDLKRSELLTDIDVWA